MSYVPKDVGDRQYTQDELEDEFHRIQEELDQLLTTQETGRHNAMKATLDMGGHYVKNAPEPFYPTDPVRIEDILSGEFFELLRKALGRD